MFLGDTRVGCLGSTHPKAFAKRSSFPASQHAPITTPALSVQGVKEYRRKHGQDSMRRFHPSIDELESRTLRTMVFIFNGNAYAEAKPDILQTQLSTITMSSRR
jgi:hypothetical protein